MKPKTTILPINPIYVQATNVQELAEIYEKGLKDGIEIGKKLAEQKEWCSAEEAAEMLGVKKETLSSIRNKPDCCLVYRPKGRNMEYLIKSIEDHKNSK